MVGNRNRDALGVPVSLAVFAVAAFVTVLWALKWRKWTGGEVTIETAVLVFLGALVASVLVLLLGRRR